MTIVPRIYSWANVSRGIQGKSCQEDEEIDGIDICVETTSERQDIKNGRWESGPNDSDTRKKGKKEMQIL